MMHRRLTTAGIEVAPHYHPLLVLRPIRSSGSTEGALEEAGRAEQLIITEATPNELKLGEDA